MDINVCISIELSDVWKKIKFTEVILIRLISFSVVAAILANAEGIERDLQSQVHGHGLNERTVSRHKDCSTL